MEQTCCGDGAGCILVCGDGADMCLESGACGCALGCWVGAEVFMEGTVNPCDASSWFEDITLPWLTPVKISERLNQCYKKTTSHF